MKTKAQLSVFLIVGIVIVAIVFLANSFEVEKPASLSRAQPESMLDLKLYLESCLRQVGEQAIFDTTLQGGYFSAPSQSTSVYGIGIPNYWQNSVNLMPSKEEIEQELSLYVGDHLRECTQGLEAFSHQGWTIEGSSYLYEYGEYEYTFRSVMEVYDDFDDYVAGIDEQQYPVAATITPSSVIYTFTPYTTARKGDILVEVPSVSVSVPSNLDKVYSIISSFMEEQTLNPNTVPVAALSELALKNDFTFEIIHLDENKVMFGLIFPGSQKLIHSFVNVYDWKMKTEGDA